jgi:integrase
MKGHFGEICDAQRCTPVVDLGIANLSAHDGRGYWSTAAARGGTDLKTLKQAGCWNSLRMPEHYIEDAAIANLEVKLADEELRESSGAPIALVRNTLGHTSIATTGRYNHANPETSIDEYLPI